MSTFADSLPAFKEALPGLYSYALEKPVAVKLSATSAAQDAVADVNALSDLISRHPGEILVKR